MVDKWVKLIRKALHDSKMKIPRSFVLCFFLFYLSNTVANTVPVTLKILADVIFFPHHDAPGITLTLDDTKLSAEQPGVVSELLARVGDKVIKNQTLVVMDCTDYQIARRQAQAALNAERAQLKFDKSRLSKVERLSQKNNISEEEVEKRSSLAAISAAEVERNKAILAATERAVNKCRIKAPFDGVVVSRMIGLGEYLQQGVPVMHLVNRDNVEVSANIQERDLETLNESRDVVFVSNQKEFPVTLRTILPLLDSRTSSYTARLKFSADRPMPGSAGRLRWETQMAHLPAELLVRRKKLGFFVEESGYARFVPIEGAYEGQPASISKSIPLDVKVIVQGRHEIEHGDRVTTVSS